MVAHKKEKGASCTQSVAERIFKTLRSFPSQDRKEALEKAITAGWKDIYHLRRVTNQKNQKIIIQHQEYLQQKEGFSNAKLIYWLYMGRSS